jgi:uncharacterized protein YbaP (TraB family)
MDSFDRRIGRRARGFGFVLCFLLAAACGADATVGARGVLYEVRPPGGAEPSYLLGTIHSEDKRVVELPAPVRGAFDASPGIALEVVPDAAAIIKSMVTMTYTDGRSLRDVLPEDLYREAAAALGELGMPEEAFKDFKPWAVVTLLSVPASESGEFMDMMLYRSAVAQHKRIEGLESIEEQLAVFDDLDESDQVGLLRETLASRDQLPVMFEELVGAYLSRDLDALLRLSERYLQDGDPRLAALFREAAIDSRNRRMAERMVPLLDQGGWFIAIGALHLPAADGVLARLRQRGYAVSAVY